MSLFPFSFLQNKILYDPDAQAFFNRVTTAGGSLTFTEKTATNQLVLDLKSYGIWSSMQAIYPMVGASAAACAQNLVSSSFTGNFSSGWTFASTGVTPNGTSAYMNTGLSPSAVLSQNNASLGYYGSSTSTSVKCAVGSIDNVTISCFDLYPAYTGVGMFGDINDGSNTFTANTNSSGFILASRINSTQKKHYIRNTANTLTENSKTPNNYNIYVGARNRNGTAQDYFSYPILFIFIGYGLTDTQASNFYNAVQTFQTTLSRQV